MDLRTFCCFWSNAIKCYMVLPYHYWEIHQMYKDTLKQVETVYICTFNDYWNQSLSSEFHISIWKGFTMIMDLKWIYVRCFMWVDWRLSNEVVIHISDMYLNKTSSIFLLIYLAPNIWIDNSKMHYPTIHHFPKKDML